MTKKMPKSFIGIDVSKKQLEVAVHESDYHFHCPNKASAFGGLIAELIKLRPALIVLEATGGLEIPVVSALHAAGLPVVVVNPRQVRDFAKALGQLAKTDRLDARVLAHFAAAIKPPLRPIKSKEERDLDALTGRRGQLIEILIDEKNRRASAANDTVRLDKRGHLRAAGPIAVPIKTVAVKLPPGKVTHLAVNTRTASTAPATTHNVVAKVAPEPVAANSTKTYVVQAGDTLYGIGQRFGVAVDALRSLNRLSARAILKPGLTLRLQ